MKTLEVGLLIRRRRLEMGLTQEKLCEGICNISTLSKIENGKQAPSKLVAEALIERLGNSQPNERFFVDAQEFKVQNLQQEITSYIVSREFDEAKQKIKELKSISKKEDKIIAQFIEHSKVMVEMCANETTPKAQNEKLLKLLFEVLERTVPKFNIDEIEKNLLCLEEVRIINNIAIIYARLGDKPKAIDIYRALLRYSEKQYTDMEETGSIIALVAYNFSKQLGLDGNYRESLEVAEKGYEFCVKYGRTRLIAGLLINMSSCYYEMGRDEECKARMYESYYISRAIKRYDNCDMMAKYAKDTFDIVFP